MRLTSPKDMVVGLSLASALLCFKLGAVFGPNPPSGFYRDLATASGAPPAPVAQPMPIAASELTPDLAPTVATFNDTPAPIGEVRISGSRTGTRIALQLGPGQADPRLAITHLDGRPTLTVSGLAAPSSSHGDGSGLVQQWTLNDANSGGRLELPLTAPARVSRAFLTSLDSGDRRLILDLAPACPVGGGRPRGLIVNPPRAMDARQIASLD